jgi:hypothetical protein
VVLLGNNLKNKILYKHDSRKEQPFKEMTPPATTADRIILEMSNDAIFGGLSFSFEQDAPNEARNILSAIDANEFRLTIMNVNKVLQENIPCVGYVMLYSLCCPFTCGLTAMPLWRAGGKAEEKVREYLAEQNEKYEKLNVIWELHVRNKNTDTPCSWIEVRFIKEPESI